MPVKKSAKKLVMYVLSPSLNIQHGHEDRVEGQNHALDKYKS